MTRNFYKKGRSDGASSVQLFDKSEKHVGVSYDPPGHKRFPPIVPTNLPPSPRKKFYHPRWHEVSNDMKELGYLHPEKRMKDYYSTEDPRILASE